MLRSSQRVLRVLSACFNEVDIRVLNIINEYDCNVLVFSISANYVIYEVCVCMYLFVFIYL